MRQTSIIKIGTLSIVAAAVLSAAPAPAPIAPATITSKIQAMEAELAKLRKIEKAEKARAEEAAKAKEAAKAPVVAGDLEPLQDEIEKLKAANKDLESRLSDVEEKSDSLETSILSNKLRFGLGFRQRVDAFHKKMGDGSKVDQSNIWTTRLNLNMNSKITDTMKFNGRLTMFKYWSDSAANALSTRDSTQGRLPGNSGLYVERAYVDWMFLKGSVPLTLTLGRQPSSDGPSHELKENTTRKSTYSALSFDGAADGAVLTADLKGLTGMENAAIRIAYGKAYQPHDYFSASHQVNNYTGVDNGLKDCNVAGLFVDGAIPGVSNSLIQVGYVKAVDLPMSDMDMNASSNAILGDFAIYGLMMQADNIADSGLSLFAHAGFSKAEPNGKGGSYGLLTSSGDTKTKNGSAYWVGGRYAATNGLKLGYEYNHGSQYWFNFDIAPQDLTNKLAARGSAHEVYAISEINRYSYLRLGATVIDYDYTGSGDYRGQPMKPSDLAAAMPSMKDNAVEKTTNYYLLFNLLF